MENYPAVGILVNHGKWLATLVALGAVLAALIAVLLGAHWLWLIAGLGLGALGALLIKALSEMTVIITDMLLPK